MLRKIRLAAALLFFTMITLLFLDFTGTVHGWFGWMAKIQFLPAVLALNVGVVIALVLLNARHWVSCPKREKYPNVWLNGFRRQTVLYLCLPAELP